MHSVFYNILILHLHCSSGEIGLHPCICNSRALLQALTPCVPGAGVRVHDFRDDGGCGAGVHDRAGGRARGAVDQALQLLHPLLRADRRQPRARDARRRRHRRRIRGLRAQRLPPLPLVAAALLRFRPTQLVGDNNGPSTDAGPYSTITSIAFVTLVKTSVCILVYLYVFQCMYS
jgi:hypothetical protein